MNMNNNKNIRIIQTFWGGGHNPLECGYGWSHAEHNLMSWALSCHSLREHYSQVELYTDQRGYDVLIGKLAFAREKMSSANWPGNVNHFRESRAHPTNPVEGCADANPKTMLPNDT